MPYSRLCTLGLAVIASTTACKDDAPATVDDSANAAICNGPSDCPDPGNECLARLCVNRRCGVMATAAGTPLAAQAEGDCRVAVCDGRGGRTSAPDGFDVSVDDNECTLDACRAGSLVHDSMAVRSPCGAGGGRVCNAAGSCVGCVDDGDCRAGSCSAGSCVSASCLDGVRNGAETDIDCGGSCAPCAGDRLCGRDGDCGSGLCLSARCASTTPIITDLSPTGSDRLFGVTFDQAGNVLAAGVASTSTRATSDFAIVVARFKPNGALDPTFGTGGVVTRNLVTARNGELARGITVQSSGKIVVVATIEHAGATDVRDRDIAVVRLESNGAPDPSFGSEGVTVLDLGDGLVVGNGYVADAAWGVSAYPDDKLLISGSRVRTGGTDSDFVLVRLGADGALDPTFGSAGVVGVDIENANASPRAMVILPDGKAVGSGYMEHGGVVTPVLFRVTANGQLDPSFGNGGVFNRVVLAAQTEIYGIGMQGSKIVTAGYGRADATTESLDFLSLRVLPNGTLDPTYGREGVARLDVAGFGDNARNVLVLPDERVLVLGGGRPTANDLDGVVAILTPDGQPDRTYSPSGWRRFDLGGPADMFWSAALAPSGSHVVVVGLAGAGTTGRDDDSALLLVPVRGASPSP